MRRITLSLSLLLFFISLAKGNDGFAQYSLCAACHGQSGEGTQLGPPLAESEWVNGPEENLIRILLLGLKGPIEVKGVNHHFVAGMPPLSHLTDENIASVLTFVRSSFGNQAPEVTAASVAALRKKGGTGPLTVADLLPPSSSPPPKSKSPGKYDSLDTSDGPPIWLYVAGSLAVAGGSYFLFRRS